MSLMETLECNLAFDLVRVAEAAALASARRLGRGDKNAGDGAAVDAMRLSFNSLPIAGKVVIGEGRKDEAPMFYSGEIIGMGNGPFPDIAMDPAKGTNLLVYGRPNAIAAVGAAPGGSMYNPGPSFHMQELVVGQAARDVIDLDAPVHVNLRLITRALGKDTDDLVVFVLDKPRHQELIQKIRAVDTRIQLRTDGDVAGTLMAVDQRSEVDVMMGIGGTPEGVLVACAIKGAGGAMLARLDPQSEAEKAAIREAGIGLAQILDADMLVQGDDVFFAATGISGGTFLRDVQLSGQGAVTHSTIIRSKTGTMRYIESHHNWNKLMQISSIKYD